jgi:hypothetical protein
MYIFYVTRIGLASSCATFDSHKVVNVPMFRRKAYRCLTSRELEIYLSLPRDLARQG